MLIELMSLRPRYSLLTLLVLTGLVAGGVKWWRGPHHFVERTGPKLVVDYTFTRAWGGQRIVHGPHVERTFDDRLETLQEVQISFYRAGTRLPWLYTYTLNEAMHRSTSPQTEFPSSLELSPREQQEWQQAIEQERNRFATPERHLMGYWWWKADGSPAIAELNFPR